AGKVSGTAPQVVILDDLRADHKAKVAARSRAGVTRAALDLMKAGRNVAVLVPSAAAAAALLPELIAGGLRRVPGGDRLGLGPRRLRFVLAGSDPAALRHFNGRLIWGEDLDAAAYSLHWPKLADTLEVRCKIRAAVGAERPAPVAQLDRLGGTRC
ncbi:hypothetical protein, partial [Sulfitobacter indolifex]